MHDVIFDMETSDPDDGFTLALLATHPGARLLGVTVTPGTRAQVGVVRAILKRVGRESIPVGARDPASTKDAVNPFHDAYLGPTTPTDPDDLAHRLLARLLQEHPAATVLTGAPLQNLRLLLTNHPETRIRRWVGQGGFAGDPVVPPAHRLPKFAGLETCPTFNFNGDPRAALLMLTSPQVLVRDLVSKNVCHGVAYDQALHDRLLPERQRTAGIDLIVSAMERYLRKRPEGKLLHDPLAACVLLRRDLAELREVEVYRESGRWGSRLATGTGCFITVAVDQERFVRVLLGDEPPLSFEG
jgi:pyrimidine-specific ribonucleoside hydrolase